MTARPRAELWKSVAAERRIDLPAAHLYRIIADFDRHHPRFLPEAFRDVRVVSGGVGAGTVITFDVASGTNVRHFRSEVSEPEPGRVLVEEDRTQGARTTFRVTPESGGALVRIENEFRASPGLRGVIERIIAPPVLRRLLAEELARLEAYARSVPVS
jgi:uncharacterized protein YndB with AHSA1/START domain